MNHIIWRIIGSIFILCFIVLVVFTVKIHDMLESRNELEIGYIDALKILTTRNYDSEEEIVLKNQLEKSAYHHIRIYYGSDQKPLLSHTISALKEAHMDNNRLIGQYPAPPVDLILFQNEEQFLQYAQISYTNGYYSDFDKIIGILPVYTDNDDYRKETIRYMVKHEYSHYALLQKIQAMGVNNPIPEWFLEGYAEYLSFIHSSPFNTAETAGSIIPFDNLEKSEQWKHLRTAGVIDIYRQSQEAIAYIVDEFGDEIILAILKEADQADSFEQAIHRSTGLNYDDLENQLIQSMHE